MARLVYSLSGEGRGHATRAETVIAMLSRHHDLLVYAPPIAHDSIRSAFEGHSRVTLRRLDCLRFRYNGQKLSYLRSTLAALPFLSKMVSRVRRISREVREWQATHVINDFEPLLSRVANRLRLPWIGVDHQHFLTAIDPNALPSALATKIRLLRPSVWMFCPCKGHQIVSSYFDYPLRANSTQTIRKTGVLLRDAVLRCQPGWGDHLIAYLRRDLPNQLYQSLKACGRTVHIYGLGSQASDENLRFHQTSTTGFLEHLSSSVALVCSSGNQLIGEALHLGKPILAVPEHGNFEQEINGHFLPKTGGGTTVALADVTCRTISEFVDQRERYLLPDNLVGAGNEAVELQLLEWINGGTPPSRPQMDPATVRATAA